MNMIVNVAERIPDVVEKIAKGASEFIIAPKPSIISPAANAVQVLTAQAFIGLLCIFCMGLALFRLWRNPVLDSTSQI